MLKQLHDSVPPTQRQSPWFKTKFTSIQTIQERKSLVKGSLGGHWGDFYDDCSLYLDGEIDFDHPNLPAWIGHAYQVTLHKPLDSARDLGSTPKSKELFYFLSPITNYGYHLISEYLLGVSLSVSSNAAQGLVAGLGRRIMLSCIDVFSIEVDSWFNLSAALNPNGKFTVSVDSSTYPDLYARYPALAFIIGHGIAQWFDASKEMIERLVDDLSSLSKTFTGGDPICLLDDVSMDTGDIHDNGRSVALLTFNQGFKVAYKPKDLRIVDQVQRLFHRINLVSGIELLHVRALLVRESYAWEEFVEFKECDSSDDVSLYYWRYGAMIKVYEFLRARDLWLDNVIAHGSWPVVIDLEMVLQPWIAPSEVSNASEFRAQEIIEDSAYPIGLISMMFPIDNAEPFEDMGGLTPSRPFRTPFRASMLHQADDNPDGRVYLDNNIYTPMVDGVCIDSTLWRDQVLKGYVEMDELFEGELINDILNWIDLLEPSLSVRAIYRDTWTYQKILNVSCSAHNLRSVFHRESFLATLPSSLQALYDPSSTQYRIVFSEVDQLRRLDIPYFISSIGDSDIRNGDCLSLGPIFYGSALNRIIKRCHDNSSKGFRRDCLAGALDSGFGCKGIQTQINLVSSALTLKDTIYELTELVLSWSILVNDDYSWVTFTSLPSTNTILLQSVRPTYSGLLKLAIVLRKAQLCTGMPSLSQVIFSLRRQVDVCRQKILLSMSSSPESWHFSEYSGLPGIEKGIAWLKDADIIDSPDPAKKPLFASVQLSSSTRIPPRLWLLGQHGVFSLLDSLCDQFLVSSDLI